eukprot:5535090-Amphidinium_carterae.4
MLVTAASVVEQSSAPTHPSEGDIDLQEHDTIEQSKVEIGAGVDVANDAALASGSAEKYRSPELHAQDRSKAAAWLSTKPLSVLVVMRVSMAPLVDLLHKQLYISSEEYELHERAKQARALAIGDKIFRRNYMLTVAASNALEKAYFGELANLFHEPKCWQLVEESNTL